MRIAVFGLGYTGTVTRACLADQSHVGVDVDESKVASDQIVFDLVGCINSEIVPGYYGLNN